MVAHSHTSIAPTPTETDLLTPASSQVSLGLSPPGAVWPRERSFTTMLYNALPSQMTVAFFVLGLGLLVLYNALLSVIDFYSLLFPAIRVPVYITNCYTFPLLLSATITVIWPIPARHRPTAIAAAFILLLIFAVLFPLLTTRAHPFQSAEEGLSSMQFRAIIILSALLGLHNGVLETTLFGMVSLFPDGGSIIALNAGDSSVSVLLVTTRIFTRIFLDSDAKPSPETLSEGFHMFFVICTILCSCCLLAFVWLHTYSTEYAKFVKEEWKRLDASDSVPLWDRILEVVRTFTDIKTPAICLFISFSATLLFFPNISTTMPVGLRAAASPTWRSWFPAVVVALFAYGDTVGRIAFTSDFIHKYKSTLPWLTLLRVAIVLSSIVQWSANTCVSGIIILTTVFIHAILNGIVLNMAFVVAPSMTTYERREAAGRIMLVMIVGGLCVGSALSWIVTVVLRQLTAF